MTKTSIHLTLENRQRTADRSREADVSVTSSESPLPAHKNQCRG